MYDSLNQQQTHVYDNLLLYKPTDSLLEIDTKPVQMCRQNQPKNPENIRSVDKIQPKNPMPAFSNA